MVSDKPLPDRCAGKVISKLGADLRIGPEDADDGIEVDDRDIVLLRLSDTVDPNDATSVIESYPDYETYREYLWNDYAVTAFALDTGHDVDLDEIESSPYISHVDTDRPPMGRDLDQGTSDQIGFSKLETATRETIEDEVVQWVRIDPEADRNVTNSYNELDGYCERYPLRDGNRCHDHQGGGAPEGNTNAMTHGLRAKRTNYYKSLDEKNKRYVEDMVDSWLTDAPFDRNHRGKIEELYRAAIDQHRALNAVDEFVDEDGNFVGLTKEVTIDYDDETKEEVTGEEEHPANLPYSRLDGDIINKLEKLGVVDSPDAQEAEATQSLAKKLSGMDD